MIITIEKLKEIQNQLDLVEGAVPDYSLGRGRGYKDDITEMLALRGVVAATDVIDRLIEFMEGGDEGYTNKYKQQMEAYKQAQKDEDVDEPYRWDGVE